MCSSGGNDRGAERLVMHLMHLGKKPTLETNISEVLHEFHEHILYNKPIFSECAVFINNASEIYGKQVDLLYKGMIKLATELNESFRSHEEQAKQMESENTSRTSTEPPVVEIKTKRGRKKKEVDPQPALPLETTNNLNSEPTADPLNDPSSNNEIVASEQNQKFSIPGIPDEIMEKLHLSDCMLGGPIDEFIDKLDPNDPRYQLFIKLGQEISKNKDVFTYNNLSLSGISWNALFEIEKVLNRNKEKDSDLTDNHFDDCSHRFDSEIDSNINMSQNSENSHCTDLNTEVVNDGGISSTESCYGSMIGSVRTDTTLIEGSQQCENEEAMDTLQVNSENGTQFNEEALDTSQVNSENGAQFNEEAMDNSQVNTENGTQFNLQSKENCGAISILQAENEPATDTSLVDSSINPENGIQSSSQISENVTTESAPLQNFNITTDIVDNNGNQCSSQISENEAAMLTSPSATCENSNITTDIVSLSVDELGLVVEGNKENKILETKTKIIPLLDLPINMFKFPSKLLSKCTLFLLPEEIKPKTKPPPPKSKDTTLKRKSTDLPGTGKKLKSVPLGDFEKFWSSDEAQKELPEGEERQHLSEQQEITCLEEQEDELEITVEIETVEGHIEISETYTDIRKQLLDNPNEWRPITPESGRGSFFSEFGHLDEDDDGPRRDPTLSRADSGIEISAPLTPASLHPDELVSRTSENSTLKTLQTLFPTTFSDPERAHVLKDIYRQPEDSEEYNEWKKFIDEKTANETEFDIHKGGDEILNNFPTKVEGETISFQSIVQDKPVGDVARLFVSALQLANTYNVEIQDDFPNQIRADAMKLKFLSDERPHEDLDMFGPSTSSIDNFMSGFREDSSRNQLRHSTPYTHADPAPIFNKKSAKRRRLDYSQ